MGLSADNEILFWENQPSSGTVEVDPELVFGDGGGGTGFPSLLVSLFRCPVIGFLVLLSCVIGVLVPLSFLRSGSCSVLVALFVTIRIELFLVVMLCSCFSLLVSFVIPSTMWFPDVPNARFPCDVLSDVCA